MVLFIRKRVFSKIDFKIILEFPKKSSCLEICSVEKYKFSNTQQITIELKPIKEYKKL